MAISIKNKTRHLLSRRISWLKNKTSLAAIAALVIVPSITVLAFTYGPMASIEAEDSQLSGGATVVADSNASGGESIRFGSGDEEALVMPDSTNTGPRLEILRTLTASEALSELRDEEYLSQVRITGNLQLSGSDGINWVIEDSIIETNHLYGIQGYSNLTPFTGTYEERPVFRYVEVIGRAARDAGSCSSNILGGNMVLEYLDVYGCEDGIKPSSNLDMISSWFHDNDRPTGAHCDSIQIRSGTNTLFRGNRMDAYVGYVSDDSSVADGATCNGVLQTGPATNNISVTFEDNWFSGGHYTIRGWVASDELEGTMNYVFRDNKWREFGESVALGLNSLEPNQYGATRSRLGDFDASNVWEHTGLPVVD